MTFDPEVLLRQVFPGMAEDARQEMARLAKVTNYPAGTMLCHEGALEEVFYIIGEGEVSVTQQLGNEERFLRTSGPGQYFGEMALIDNEPRSATALAITDVELVPISEKQFLFLVSQTPYFALKVMRILAQRLRATNMSLD